MRNCAPLVKYVSINCVTHETFHLIQHVIFGLSHVNCALIFSISIVYLAWRVPLTHDDCVKREVNPLQLNKCFSRKCTLPKPIISQVLFSVPPYVRSLCVPQLTEKMPHLATRSLNGDILTWSNAIRRMTKRTLVRKSIERSPIDNSVHSCHHIPPNFSNGFMSLMTFPRDD